MVKISPMNATTNPAPAERVKRPNTQCEPGRSAAPGGVIGEGILRFGDADWQPVEAVRIQPGDLLLGFDAEFHAIRAVDFGRDFVQLFGNGPCEAS